MLATIFITVVFTQLPLASAFVTRQPVAFLRFVPMQASMPADVHSDDEWHPRDPAFTTPQLLVGIWQQIAQATSMAKGVSKSVTSSAAMFIQTRDSHNSTARHSYIIDRKP